MRVNSAGTALFSLLLAGCVARTSGHPPSPEPLRVATLNLAHGRGLAYTKLGVPRETFEGNIDAVARLLARERADVVALQEADAPSVWSGAFDHVQRLADAAAYPHVYHGIHFEAGIGPARLRYGTALLARRPLRSSTSDRFSAGRWDTKGFVAAEIEFAGRPLTVVSVHLDSKSPATRRRQVNKMVAVLGAKAGPLLLMGDLNSRWKNEADAVRLLSSQLALQAYQPDRPGMHTFRANAPTKRIDWILISRELEFVSYHVWPDQVSDHFGVAAEIRWRE